jgi:hypothetical protein
MSTKELLISEIETVPEPNGTAVGPLAHTVKRNAKQKAFVSISCCLLARRRQIAIMFLAYLGR